jgi:hypothetical protein
MTTTPDDSLVGAVSMIDAFMAGLGDRKLLDMSEVVDFVLDLRNMLDKGTEA